MIASMIILILDLNLIKSISLEEINIFQTRESRFYMAISPSNTVCFWDESNQRLMLMKADGELISAGRQGQGPGEFNWVRGLSWSEAERCFLVVDFKNLALSRWREDGQYLSSQRLPSYRYDDVVLKNGFLFWTSERIDNYQKTVFYKMKIGDEVPTILFSYENNEMQRSYPIELDNKAVLSHQLLWRPIFRFAVGKQGYVHTDQLASQITIFDHKDAPIKKNLKVEPRLPLTKEEYMEITAGRFQKYLRAFSYTEVLWPSVYRIIYDDKDHIWIYGKENYLNKERSLMVLDPKGNLKYKGMTKQLPRMIHKGRIYVLESEDESHYLRIYEHHLTK